MKVQKTTNLDNLSVPKPRPSTQRITRMTNRGTDSRKNTNKGKLMFTLK